MSSSSICPENRLLFRRQFILGPAFVENFSGWRRIEIRKRIRVTAHPDLPVTHARSGPCSVTLLGYMLDPQNPESTDREIVGRLLDGLRRGLSAEVAPEATEALGGRWVLVVDDGVRVLLFQDPMGLRSAFWTDPSMTGAVWVASQPAPLAELLGLERDKAAQDEFVSSDVYREWAEYRWPADATPYRAVRRLLPNRMLDVLGGRTKRYWPARGLRRFSLEECVEAASGLLVGLIRAAARRFPLSLATTAGWDTRLILAASKDVAGELSFFTFLHSERKADITTAPRLVRRLGFSHTMIDFPDRASAEFASLYKRNVTDAHEAWAGIAEAGCSAWPEGRVCMTGNGAEIVRSRPLPAEPLTARNLARWMSPDNRFRDRLASNSFALKAWGRWLADLPERTDILPWDLFFWDTDCGYFAATGEAEFDIVYESFTPFSCRRLLETMLGVEEQWRLEKQPAHYLAIIRRLWPEALSEPINQPYEGILTPLLRAARQSGWNGLVTARTKTRMRKILRIG